MVKKRLTKLEILEKRVDSLEKQFQSYPKNETNFKEVLKMIEKQLRTEIR